jgi:RNA recognition motif-containing protein
MESKRLFVGFLSIDTTAEDLKQAFEEFGTVTEAMVIRDHEGASRGFGFIEMATAEEAKAARKALDRTLLDGSFIIVDAARPKKQIKIEQVGGKESPRFLA